MENGAGPIGIIIVAHGDCGAAILRAVEAILGAQSDCVSISVDLGHKVEDAVARLKDAATRLDRGQGVIALTDMFGGTPTNLALTLMGKHNVEVVTGANLPMALKVFESRQALSLPDLARAAAQAGKGGIVITGDMLRSRNREKTEAG